MNLQEIGLTEEKLQQMFVDRLVNEFCEDKFSDEEGNDVYRTSGFAQRIEAAYKNAIESKVNELAEKVIIPHVYELIEKCVLQPTNKWGEKAGEPMSFKEYLLHRAEKWMTEAVDYQGKTQDQDSYGWKKSQTRVAHMIHEHLHYTIDNAVKDALRSFNGQLSKGLQETVKVKLEEAFKGLTIQTVIR